jgi:hypothetical protein
MNSRSSKLLLLLFPLLTVLANAQYTIPLVISNCKVTAGTVNLYDTWQNSNATCIVNVSSINSATPPWSCIGTFPACRTMSTTTCSGGCIQRCSTTTTTTCPSANITVTTNDASCQEVGNTAFYTTETTTSDVIEDCEPC